MRTPSKNKKVNQKVYLLFSIVLEAPDSGEGERGGRAEKEGENENRGWGRGGKERGDDKGQEGEE